jgi:broad specificity phosphatase PhoE
LLDSYPNLQPEVILSSPLTRTLQTTLLGFGKLLRRPDSPQLIVTPDLQECGPHPCDTGSDQSNLVKRFNEKASEKDGYFVKGAKSLDFSAIDDGNWNSKSGLYSCDTQCLQSRAARIRETVRDRHEKNIVIVSHGGRNISERKEVD